MPNTTVARFVKRNDLCSLSQSAVNAALDRAHKRLKAWYSDPDTFELSIVATCEGSERLIDLPAYDEHLAKEVAKTDPGIAALWDLHWRLAKNVFIPSRIFIARTKI